MITAEMPWPSKYLWPNRSRREHWATSGGARRKAKELATVLWISALKRREGLKTKHVELHVVAIPPDRRKRDLDNIIAACKPYIDGAQVAGAILDDCWIRSIRAEVQPPAKRGARVILSLKERDHA